jgi:hypothetical protein
LFSRRREAAKKFGPRGDAEKKVLARGGAEDAEQKGVGHPIFFVIPANAGTHGRDQVEGSTTGAAHPWVPAFAGMTIGER